MIYKTNNVSRANRDTDPESSPASPLHLANTINGPMHTLFQRDIFHAQNSAAEGRCDKWNVVHRYLIELYILLFGRRVVDRLENGDQLVMDE